MMKKLGILFAGLLWCSSIFAQDRIATFVENVNRYAATDLPGFQKRLHDEYNVPNNDLDECYKRCGKDWGNVGMVLEIARATGKSPKEVCGNYERNKKHGWGRVLKEAGIAPNTNYYKKFYDRVDNQGKSWKKSHDAYRGKHPQAHKNNDKQMRHKDKKAKPKK